MELVQRVVLIGFSGTGKSTLARILAQRLGWTAADCDDEIDRRWGVAIPTIFRDHGEAAFRASERSVLRELIAKDEIVIATGGGAAADPFAWSEDALGRPGTLVVALDAEPRTILERLRRQAQSEGEVVERPMLAAADPLARIDELKSSRQAAYDAAHLTLSTEGTSLDVVADEIAAVTRLADGQPLRVRLEALSGSSEIEIGAGAINRLGCRVRDSWPNARRAWIVTDANVGPLHAAAASHALESVAMVANCFTVPAGEGSKSLRQTGELYDWLLGSGIERSDVVVALGGGVVGDLAGFVAATVLRGVGLVQAPTSLLAAVDSSVGGKTGINHAAGKNLIGAFLQPRLVIVDTNLLHTVPPRELRSGWAEVVKHAIIQRSTPGGERGDLRTVLTRNRSRLLSLAEPALSYLIARNIGLKAAVVAADEREQGGRALLNFGHTLGHAIEASDYRLLHGEAIALGMVAAADLGVSCGTCGRAEADAIEDLIAEYDLPRSARLDEPRVLSLLGSDKKRTAGRQRLVLPIDNGGVVIRDDVAKASVAQALSVVNERSHEIKIGGERSHAMLPGHGRQSPGEGMTGQLAPGGRGQATIVVTGSLAYDYIMTFPGSFQDHIIPDKTHILSVSFLFDSLRRQRGGVAGNVAYNLALLGERPAVVGAGGADFGEYRAACEQLGVDMSAVLDVGEELTGSSFMTTDLSGNQIAGFYPGASLHAAELCVRELARTALFGFVGPTTLEAMRRHAREFVEAGCLLIYDPSQQVVSLSSEDLRDGIDLAWALIGSDYEMAVIAKKTGLSVEDLVARVPFVGVTLGKNGSTLYRQGETVNIPAAPAEYIGDPTGGGDAYRAGLIKGLILGLPLEVAGRMGSLAATYSVERYGPQEQLYSAVEYVARFDRTFPDWAGSVAVEVLTRPVEPDVARQNIRGVVAQGE